MKTILLALLAISLYSFGLDYALDKALVKHEAAHAAHLEQLRGL